ncbi:MULTISPECIES: hypothetical protein [Aneurinibacillus]|jgi:hypothetical protein|uniref:Uncharacterized protein n=1 Tax=Aneurinibacillus thermoaerophilus TaxID=143495 RepID=A0A1G8CA33_ANETH|nr:MULTISPECIES: hypothetical protein [Aneurinibacillus]MED0675388.1 hypothetical protein [Aneurinibacillus thermoaerophilus]MED0681182.1 hypothetical protein [Aneurinibacillus thermoaerophilus]MED0735422.1 hypothetical protein [Aneurinibacillus thermoaerophilus]MED0757328.1 hypothetical protein [Aneurinibacillus thermoaerophilus]MED0761459.1 hypothetical protein [Aneurinibacillus thermoaerophilus]
MVSTFADTAFVKAVPIKIASLQEVNKARKEETYLLAIREGKGIFYPAKTR